MNGDEPVDAAASLTVFMLESLVRSEDPTPIGTYAVSPNDENLPRDAAVARLRSMHKPVACSGYNDHGRLVIECTTLAGDELESHSASVRLDEDGDGFFGDLLGPNAYSPASLIEFRSGDRATRVRLDVVQLWRRSYSVLPMTQLEGSWADSSGETPGLLYRVYFSRSRSMGGHFIRRNPDA